jgi:predicted permease
MRTFFEDIRFGVRILGASPGLAVIAILTLALGIASSTVAFSWIDGMLYSPMPGTAGDHELAAYQCNNPDGSNCGISYAEFRYYRDNMKLASIAVDFQSALNVGDALNPDQVWGQLVSGNYFELLGVKPRLGRFFAGDERSDKPGAGPVAVVSSRYWETHLGGDPNVAGKTIKVNRRTLTIIGVAPEGFIGYKRGLAFEIWIPAIMKPLLTSAPDATLSSYSARDMHGFVWLRRGTGVEQASAEIQALARRLAAEQPDTNRRVIARILRFTEGGNDARSLLAKPLGVLMGVCVLVLLIACANVANLLLARATARQKEFSIRMALGAGGARLARQLLTETLVLAALAAALGILFSQWMMPLLRYVAPPTNLPIDTEVPLSSSALGFAVLAALAAALVCGTAPAIHAIRCDLNENLKDQGGRGSTAGGHTHRLRALLVVSEMALALVALVGAGLFLRSFRSAATIHPGFEPRNVLVSQFYLWTSGYSRDEQKLFCRRLREAMETAPGVEVAGYSTFTPLGFPGSPRYGLSIEGYVPHPGEDMGIDRAQVTPGYFRLMRIPVLEGREFTAQDDEAGAPVMIVNQEFARRFYGGANPLGRRVRAAGRWFTIVGLARNGKYHRFMEPQQSFLYVPFDQTYGNENGIDFYVRTAGDPALAASVLRRKVASLDAGARVYGSMPLSDYIEGSLYAQKFAASLLGILGATALVLAVLGLYSVMSYTVSQRIPEIGIRMAMGSRGRDVIRTMVMKGMGMTCAGLLAGLAAAFALTHLAGALLTGVSVADPAIYAAAAIFLACVALAASLIPAWRAARVNPVEALRRR